MALKRRDPDGVCFALFIVGHIATSAALSGVNNKTGPNLDCTNDYIELMFCRFEGQNCTEYSLILQSKNGHGAEHCIPKQCDSGQCCCSINMILVSGETYDATVRKGGKSVESKIISIKDSIKPRTPTIVSVNESYGNFQIMWKTNMEGSVIDNLTANVTYHKKGDTRKVSDSVRPTTVNGLKYYEILRGALKPSTTYAVSVKSYTDWSGRFSDSSEGWEFTTPASPVSSLAIIVSLSVAAVIISGAIYGCYVKFKTKWWDTVAKGPNPKLLIMHPGKQEILKPVPLIISSICVEPLVPDDSKLWSKGSQRDTSSGSSQQSSSISTGSSCLSYAKTEPADIIAGVQDALGKAFANISPISPLTTNPLTESNKDSGLFSAPYNPCGVRADDTSSGSSGFDNKTYSILIPSCPHEITTDSSEVRTEMPCDSAYHPSEGDIVICADQRAPACPLVNLPPAVSSLMPTVMSYQQCNADSGRLPNAEDSSLSSISSGGLVPPRSHSFPPVDGNYQAFQNLVERPDILFSENRSVEKEENFNKYPEESFARVPQSFSSPVVPGFINNVHGGQCLSELRRPFLPLIAADQSMPVITDDGYQSV